MSACVKSNFWGKKLSQWEPFLIKLSIVENMDWILSCNKQPMSFFIFILKSHFFPLIFNNISLEFFFYFLMIFKKITFHIITFKKKSICTQGLNCNNFLHLFLFILHVQNDSLARNEIFYKKTEKIGLTLRVYRQGSHDHKHISTIR